MATKKRTTGKPARKKLALGKETLRDLPKRESGNVKGGQGTGNLGRTHYTACQTSF